MLRVPEFILSELVTHDNSFSSSWPALSPLDGPSLPADYIFLYVFQLPVDVEAIVATILALV